MTQEKLLQQYQQSGTKQTFWQWLKSEQGKGVINDTLALGWQLINKDKINENQQQLSQDDKPPEEEEEFTILGMNPITFGIVSIGILAAGLITIITIKSNKKVKTK